MTRGGLSFGLRRLLRSSSAADVRRYASLAAGVTRFVRAELVRGAGGVGRLSALARDLADALRVHRSETAFFPGSLHDVRLGLVLRGRVGLRVVVHGFSVGCMRGGVGKLREEKTVMDKNRRGATFCQEYRARWSLCAVV